MHITRWVLSGMMAVGLASATPSAADASIDGQCEASARFRLSGVTIDTATTGVTEVRRADTVDWEASVPAAPGAYEGSIQVNLPAPFGAVTIDSWSGVSDSTTNSGTEDYQLPKAVPAGVVFTVTGDHSDANGVCSGSFDLRLTGSPMSSPITWVAIGGTLFTGAGLVGVAYPLFRRVA